ncbi:hydrolase [Atopomonas sediminilitoris]|uniref:hydrolase n=1 Tax=Atopomonas sediminilitoris TaxID=2919919 RepID=UPI001F4DD62D|nr:hydrolase [Atopomonas sediminilitoris]MCJ8170586.1 hydrolase [Atopomonas sediminilitoris]
MTRSFTPAWWLPGPHLQTLYGPLLRRRSALARQRERLWLADGDFLDLDWHKPQGMRHDAPLTVLLHGLTGSSDSHYVLGLQQALAKRCWPSVAVNWRGCSGEVNRLPRSYHSGASDDLSEVLSHIAACWPLGPRIAVGYSLGGNVLLKYLGEHGSRALVTAAVAVSVPYRLDHCAERINQGFSKVYQKHFMDEMLAYLNAKLEHFACSGQMPEHQHLSRLGRRDDVHTFWDYDDRFTAPLHGYADVHDYYRRASSRFYLGEITVPCLLIQAQDDPFVFRHSLPEARELSPSTTHEWHRHGGHVGFVEAQGFYLERRIPEWLAELCRTA